MKFGKTYDGNLATPFKATTEKWENGQKISES